MMWMNNTPYAIVPSDVKNSSGSCAIYFIKVNTCLPKGLKLMTAGDRFLGVAYLSILVPLLA